MREQSAQLQGTELLHGFKKPSCFVTAAGCHCWGQGTRLLPSLQLQSVLFVPKTRGRSCTSCKLALPALIVHRVINIWNQVLHSNIIKLLCSSAASMRLQEQHRAPVVCGSIVSLSWDVNLSLKERTSWPTGNRAALNSSRAHVKFSWHHYPFP